MGGPTGQTKDGIIRAMYVAEHSGTRAYVKQLAEQLNVKINTISGHMIELEAQGYIRQHMHGQWFLTPAGKAYARSLQPVPRGIEYRGYIAAGPAIPISQENLGEFFLSEDLDPVLHFALRVKGKSMTRFDISDGDLIILRHETNWLNVPAGAIVAAYVPEGTYVEGDDWLERLEQQTSASEEAHEPRLDHGTLKKIDVRTVSFIRRGAKTQQFDIRLQGSHDSRRIRAAAVGGILVERRHRYPW